MIKIEIDNIETVKNAHFSGVKDSILRKVNFYLSAFRVIDRHAGFDIDSIQNFASLSTRTKTSLLKIMGRNSRSFTNKGHYSRLRNQNSLSVHFYNNRINYINLLVALSNENDLRNLILSDVDHLLDVNDLYSENWFTEETVKFIKIIISYDEFTDKAMSPYNAYDLSVALNTNVCVYCNRIYTNTVIGKGKDLIIRPTLDHYFHQAEYPLLGLSFYNLIPSCNYCNSNLKGETFFSLDRHVHPYKEGFGQDATFDYLQVGFNADKSDPRNYKVTLDENIPTTNVKYLRMFGIPADDEDDSGNIKVFKLREVYQAHADVVGELILKSDKNSPYYAGNVVDLLTRLGASRKEFYRFYFANYFDEKDFSKRPLSKLTKDIVSKYFPEINK